MAAKSIKLTRAGKEKLEQELEQLIRVKRPQVIDRIRRSRDYGDLSENAEYEDARNEQSFIEGRIQEIELMLKHAEIVENDKKSGEITLGSTVEVLLGGEKLTYEIVSSTESDPLLGKISSDSPIGSALIGKKAGEEVTANTPAGEVTLKIISVK
jgi:transcription elongation factor GreA